MRYRIDLCGRWDMAYQPDAASPQSAPPEKDWFGTEAVPGWWEDIIPALQMAPFWNRVQGNPDYRPLRYPMTGVVPDMVLPTLVGCFWYRRTVVLPYDDTQDVIFTCGGVQNTALLWVNGQFVGEHHGYSTGFSLDITKFVRFGAENTLLLAVSNHAAYNEYGERISGLTSRAANLYTGGVTGSIALELRAKDAIADLFVSSTVDSFTVHAECTGDGRHTFRYTVLDGDTVLRGGASDTPEFTLPREQLSQWSPKAPKQYTLQLELLTDGEVTDVQERSFGIRALTVDGYALRLNGEPVYLRGVCEHCYFPKTVHPDPDPAYYRNVIRNLKDLDFNFIRFHTWVPPEAYLTAADGLGMLIHLESPNNTTEDEWVDIVKLARRHPSVVICCCGNELLIDDLHLAHLERCAAICHALAPGMLFSPMSAMRGVEYYWEEDGIESQMLQKPFPHNPRRMERLRACCDVFSSYCLGELSYESVAGSPEKVDSWAGVYGKPRLSHEICIHGTYVDLGLSWRYEGTRIGDSGVFSSVYDILKASGLLHRAPLYYRNSCRWQQLLRKHCFENARLCATQAGYDFLGDIDTHWHTFGYRVGMMNEFRELKPGESLENVHRYNGESVLLTDLGTKRNYSGKLPVRFSVSLFGGGDLIDAPLEVRLERPDHSIVYRVTVPVSAENGGLRVLTALELPLPAVTRPTALLLTARLLADTREIENRWNVWVYPKPETVSDDGILCTDTLDETTMAKLEAGADVLLLGPGPFAHNPMSFRISLAGRTAGNLATVIEDTAFNALYDHEGFCDWQFAPLMDNAACLYYPPECRVPFDPAIEVVSSYKWIRPQSALTELRVGKGRLLICTFRLDGDDPAQIWWRAALRRYMRSPDFAPRTAVNMETLRSWIPGEHYLSGAGANNNVAMNQNDLSMKK